MNLMTAKSIVLVTLFFLTLLFSMLPLKLVATVRHMFDPLKRARYERILSFLSCFAGGVFLSTCILDLLPEVEASFLRMETARGITFTYPVPQFVMVMGFFMVLCTEQIVLNFKEQMWAESEVRKPLLSPPDVEETRERRRHASIEGVRDQPVHTHVQVEDDFTHDLGHSGHSHAEEMPPHSAMRSVLLLVALSLHSIFEGLAIGLQTDVESLLQIFVAVTIHKCVIAFSLSLNLVQSQLKLKSIIESNIVFCLTSPIGLILGMLVDQLGNSTSTEIAAGTLQGIACGTFLYVTFFEVLPHELNTPHDRLLKLLSVIAGFSVISAVLFISP